MAPFAVDWISDTGAVLWCSDPRAGSHKIVFLTYDAGGHDECVLAF